MSARGADSNQQPRVFRLFQRIDRATLGMEYVFGAYSRTSEGKLEPIRTALHDRTLEGLAQQIVEDSLHIQPEKGEEITSIPALNATYNFGYIDVPISVLEYLRFEEVYKSARPRPINPPSGPWGSSV